MPRSRLVCPHCEEEVTVVRTSDSVQCPACSENFVAPAAPSTKSVELRRKCPGCGEGFPGTKNRCPHCGADYREARDEMVADTTGPMAPERRGIRGGVLGGLIMIVIAVVWFVLGHMAGRIFFYPFILAAIGLYAVLKGLAQGNLAGEKARARGRRRG